jgi:hypothetical protein
LLVVQAAVPATNPATTATQHRTRQWSEGIMFEKLLGMTNVEARFESRVTREA